MAGRCARNQKNRFSFIYTALPVPKVKAMQYKFEEVNGFIIKEGMQAQG